MLRKFWSSSESTNGVYGIVRGALPPSARISSPVGTRPEGTWLSLANSNVPARTANGYPCCTLDTREVLEHERDLAVARHRGFQTSEAAFQIGIVLSSISIVARARWLLFAGGGLGLVGLVLGANAFLLLVPPP